MKSKRLLLILGCLAAVLLAGYGTLRLTAPNDKVTLENFPYIYEGITKKEVEAILGAPASVEGRRFVWVGEKISFIFEFDETGRLCRSRSTDCILDREESFLAKLRRWLGM